MKYLHAGIALTVAACVLVYAPVKMKVSSIEEEVMPIPKSAPDVHKAMKRPPGDHPKSAPKPAPAPPPPPETIIKIVEVEKDDTAMNFVMSAMAGVASTFITKLIEFLFRRKKNG